MPNKLTDTEIKKALEWLKSKKNEYCEQCLYKNSEVCDICVFDKVKLALDLINRQEYKCKAYKHYYDECLKDLKNANAENESLKAEVERLKANLNIELDNFASEYDSNIKAEAYKEFAKELEDIYHFAVCDARGKCKLVERKNLKWYVDNILLKLAGDNNAGED